MPGYNLNVGDQTAVSRLKHPALGPWIISPYPNWFENQDLSRQAGAYLLSQHSESRDRRMSVSLYIISRSFRDT